MRYSILGPLHVIDEAGNGAPISAPKLRTLLAALVIRGNQVVSIDQLIDEIWGENPPRRVTAALHVYVSQLRRLIGRPDDPEGPIVTGAPGYLLRMAPEDLDLWTFQRHVQQGRAHLRVGAYHQASESLRAARDLWRGPALGEPYGQGPLIRGFMTWLEEARLECTELLVEAELELGLHRELVGPLYALTTEHPLREVFHRQLMLALYRSERQADALRVYQQARETLNGELGLEPGRALRDLQLAILTADEQLDTRLAS
ncbi:AfsR/SARP family transcriptional regulator [Embleya sp. NPDC001921]